MANWLLDYIEMTEYIPSELREQLTSIRELDLRVHNTMDELERDIKQFFSKINTLSPQERQSQYDNFLNKCDFVTQAAGDKVRVADKLHDLVEKSLRLLDQGLEKLKEDLLEGDKADIVEDLERRSKELDELDRIEQEGLLYQLKSKDQFKSNSKSNHINSNSNHLNHNNHHHHHPHHNNHHHHHHRHSIPSQHNDHLANHRSRNNSTGVQKRREKKRLNSTMTIFNRNSRSEDDSTSQSFLTSPMSSNYLAGLQDSNINLNDVRLTTMKGIMAGNMNSTINDKSNGNDSLAEAKQPILTAIDAAHAVSPNAATSDKLVLFSSNANGDNHNSTQNNNFDVTNQASASANRHPYQQVNNSHPSVSLNSGDQNNKISPSFSNLPPLTAQHDPLMVAASQAISATQNMTTGRRTSSLKASYAAVNSGRLQAPNQRIFDQSGLIPDVYCKCRSLIQGSNMIACDNSKCKIEWFHYECVNITTPPEGNWYCDECRVTLGINNKPPSQTLCSFSQ